MGTTGKTPAWRVGCWLAGVALLVVIPLGRGRQGLLETAAVLALGVLLTAPHALARLGGAAPYRPPESAVRLRPVRIPTYVLYHLLVRLPVWVGDVLYTALWRAVGEAHARHADRRAARPLAAPLPFGQDEPTWSPFDPVPHEAHVRPGPRGGRLGRAWRRADR